MNENRELQKREEENSRKNDQAQPYAKKEYTFEQYTRPTAPA